MNAHSMNESIILANFEKMGWHVESEPKMRTSISPMQFFIPDIALYDESHILIGIVEVIVEKTKLTPKKIEGIERMIELSPTPVCIVTNGHAYDIYIKGELIDEKYEINLMYFCNKNTFKRKENNTEKEIPSVYLANYQNQPITDSRGKRRLYIDN